MGRKIFTLVFLGCLCTLGFGQQTDSSKVIYMPAKVIDGDTVVVATLKEVVIGEAPKFANKFEEKQYWKLIYNLKKVYPYARMAREKLDEMNAHFLTLKNEREKKKYAKQVEDQIRAEFEDQLKSLTITQGKLLVKLICRETGNTSYALVKEFRGGLSAMFWQTLARLFGNNLKTKYDPTGEDRLMEEIVVAIESGVL
jgi:hypothetical protein